MRRRELKLTQTELAKEANLTPAAISQFESGTRKPSFKTLSSLSDALKVTTDYLLGEKPQRPFSRPEDQRYVQRNDEIYGERQRDALRVL